MKLNGIRLLTTGLVTAAASCLLAFAIPLQAANDVRVLVGFNGPPDSSVIHRAGGKVHRVFGMVPVICASMPAAAIKGLQHNPNVEYVESDRTLQAVYLPGDYVPWGIAKIGAPQVFDKANAGSGIKVAVLDTGIDPSHPDLSANYAGGYDFVWNDPIPNDENGHGTHVSGTIAAMNNDGGVVGVGPEIDIYALKFLNSAGSGYTSDEIEGVQWAVANGIKVLNMSFGSSVSSLSEKRAMDAAYAAGVLLIAAAGNNGSAVSLYPAAYSSVVSVAATDSSNNRASFSNYNADVELSAPGVDIRSTMPTYPVYLNTLGYSANYANLNGTSMATPHVSGSAALVFAANPALTNVQVRARLSSTAYDLGTAGRDIYFGYGLVNALAASSITAPVVGTGTIQGTVYQNSSVVYNASVTLLNQLGAAVATTTTNTAGYYNFSKVTAPGIYQVRAQIAKKKATSSQINLQIDSIVTMNITIK